jgi:hypothetical protein
VTASTVEGPLTSEGAALAEVIGTQADGIRAVAAVRTVVTGSTVRRADGVGLHVGGGSTTPDRPRGHRRDGARQPRHLELRASHGRCTTSARPWARAGLSTATPASSRGPPSRWRRGARRRVHLAHPGGRRRPPPLGHLGLRRESPPGRCCLASATIDVVGGELVLPRDAVVKTGALRLTGARLDASAGGAVLTGTRDASVDPPSCVGPFAELSCSPPT